VANIDQGTDSMTNGRHRLTLVFSAALTTVALVVPQAHAAATRVSKGHAVLTLTAKGLKGLNHRHIKVRATRPVKAHRRTYRLPMKKGKFDFGNNRGTLTHSGGLRLTRGRRKVTISAITITLGRKSRIVAKVGGRKVTLATLSRRAQKVRQSGTKRTVSRIRVRLSRRATALISRKLGGRRLDGRAVLASLSVEVTRSSTTAGVPADSGEPTTGFARISLAPAVGDALTQAGLDLSALPGADQLPDGSIDLPVAAVNIDPQTGQGTIDLRGGLRLGNGSTAVTIEDPQIVVGADGQSLYAQVNGVRMKIAGLENSGLSEALQSGVKQLHDTLLTISPEFASLFAQLGGLSVFVPGTPFGDLSVTLP
jgi:hypothetical protein